MKQTRLFLKVKLMSIERGNVFLARFPHATGSRGKRRPVVVVQSNEYNQRLRHAVVVQFTTNMSDKDDPACLFIKADSPTGQAAGVTKDSVVAGYLLSLMSEDRLTDRIGHLTDETMSKVEDCLRVALSIA